VRSRYKPKQEQRGPSRAGRKAMMTGGRAGGRAGGREDRRERSAMMGEGKKLATGMNGAPARRHKDDYSADS
jgi:hypothetical protein